MERKPCIPLNENWKAHFGDCPDGMRNDIPDDDWFPVTIPHNFENYHGYHKVSHGNLHGTGWYRRKLQIPDSEKGKHCFLFFEGVGAYGDVYLNGHHLGRHEGGRTCFSLEATEWISEQADNILAVRADHPAQIKDLPWVCGGCFGTPNTEGSQPLGIFRPVSLFFTDAVRLIPFGVAVTCEGIPEGKTVVKVQTEVENLEKRKQTVILESEIRDPQGEIVEILLFEDILMPGEKRVIKQRTGVIDTPCLWSPETPRLYTVQSRVWTGKDVLSDTSKNTFGIRYIQWENFPGTVERKIDVAKLAQKPGEENQNFNRYTKSGVSAKVGVEPGGVKVYLEEYREDGTIIRVESSIVNRDSISHSVVVEAFIQTYNATKHIANLVSEVKLEPGERITLQQKTERLSYLDPWTENEPVLHGVYVTIREATDGLKEYNQVYASFAICDKKGMVNKEDAYVDETEGDGQLKHRFLINGRHVFLNGTCEYEHLLGNDHAFTDQQIRARMQQIQAAGFNALREAHCPHNLRYLEACDSMGILYWAQMGAHIYFNNQNFHDNFMQLTEEWVRERRNSPSLILWGIQNESALPAVFTDEVRQLIRKLDGTATVERLVTTCNGGSGSDWNVPQNWCGTYGGSCLDYARGIKKQLLIGEYGQYRVLGLHEIGNMEQRQNEGGAGSEELFCYCLEQKVRQAEELRENVYGHFQWIFCSHANPGRETVFCMDGKGYDSVGVVNNKGLLTVWGEPVDAYYMYCSHYASSEKMPMVHIASHTWPDRFISGNPADMVVYSNCQEVELLEGLTKEGKGRISLGRKQKGKKGTSFIFEGCRPQYNILYAVGYENGKAVARDMLWLKGLNADEGYRVISTVQTNITAPEYGNYIYRINCGGKAFTDKNHSAWEADREFDGNCGWYSWAMAYPEVDSALGSVRKNYDFVKGTLDQELFEDYRYGREQLSYRFKVPNGRYVVELYFMEPWYGAIENMDCEGWRVFDVAVNGNIVRKDLDIWKKAGYKTALREDVAVEVSQEEIVINFPHVESYQAVICGIAIRLTECNVIEKRGETNYD